MMDRDSHDHEEVTVDAQAATSFLILAEVRPHDRHRFVAEVDVLGATGKSSPHAYPGDHRKLTNALREAFADAPSVRPQDPVSTCIRLANRLLDDATDDDTSDDEAAIRQPQDEVGT